RERLRGAVLVVADHGFQRRGVEAGRRILVGEDVPPLDFLPPSRSGGRVGGRGGGAGPPETGGPFQPRPPPPPRPRRRRPPAGPAAAFGVRRASGRPPDTATAATRNHGFSDRRDAGRWWSLICGSPPVIPFTDPRPPRGAGRPAVAGLPGRNSRRRPRGPGRA